MKNLTFLLLVVFSLTLMSFSCEKEETPTPEQTIEQTYPDWKNLTWVSTDDNTDTYPRLSITIEDNLVTVNQPYNATGGSYNQFEKMIISGNSVTFSEETYSPDMIITGTFLKESGYIILTTKGSTNTSHIYKLKIN